MHNALIEKHITCRNDYPFFLLLKPLHNLHDQITQKQIAFLFSHTVTNLWMSLQSSALTKPQFKVINKLLNYRNMADCNFFECFFNTHNWNAGKTALHWSLIWCFSCSAKTRIDNQWLDYYIVSKAEPAGVAKLSKNVKGGTQIHSKKRKQQKIIIVEEKDKFNRPFHSKKNKKLTCHRRKEHELLIPFKTVLFCSQTVTLSWHCDKKPASKIRLFTCFS